MIYFVKIVLHMSLPVSKRAFFGQRLIVRLLKRHIYFEWFWWERHITCSVVAKAQDFSLKKVSSKFSHAIRFTFIQILLGKVINCHIRGNFKKFPDFFVQVFKIVVNSWKFSILLLYILWDDWPLFMILGSNKQLQLELEYTIVKPDSHCWWISKMQSRREDTFEERYAIKFCFKLGKNATEPYGMLQTAFRPSCMNRASVYEWHKRLKEGRASVRDNERFGRSKEVNTPELIGQRVRVSMLRF